MTVLNSREEALALLDRLPDRESPSADPELPALANALQHLWREQAALVDRITKFSGSLRWILDERGELDRLSAQFEKMLRHDREVIGGLLKWCAIYTGREDPPWGPSVATDILAVGNPGVPAARRAEAFLRLVKRFPYPLDKRCARQIRSVAPDEWKRIEAHIHSSVGLVAGEIWLDLRNRSPKAWVSDNRQAGRLFGSRLSAHTWRSALGGREGRNQIGRRTSLEQAEMRNFAGWGHPVRFSRKIPVNRAWIERGTPLAAVLAQEKILAREQEREAELEIALAEASPLTPRLREALDHIKHGAETPEDLSKSMGVTPNNAWQIFSRLRKAGIPL